jgi:hypothetical protein
MPFWLLYLLALIVTGGLGIGLWQLGVSNLSIGGKLGVGFGVFFSIMMGVVVFLLCRRRRILSRSREQSDNMERGRNRVIGWIRAGSTGTAMPKTSLPGTSTTATNNAKNPQLLTTRRSSHRATW